MTLNLERRVQAEALLPLVTDVFLSCGMAEADARYLAGSLVDADLRGVHSHGVLRPVPSQKWNCFHRCPYWRQSIP